MQATYRFVKLPCNMRDGDMQHIVWYAMFIKFPINHSARRMTTCDFSTPYRRNHEFRWLHMQKKTTCNIMQCTFTCVLTDTCIYMYLYYIYLCVHIRIHYISCAWYIVNLASWRITKKNKNEPIKKQKSLSSPEKGAKKLWSEKYLSFLTNQLGTPLQPIEPNNKKYHQTFSDFFILNRGSVGTEVVEVPSSKIFCKAFTEAQRDLSFGSFKRWKTLGAQLSRDSKAWARSGIGWKPLSKRLALSKKSHSHRIHGTGIFTYMYHKHQANVGKYTIHG